MNKQTKNFTAFFFALGFSLRYKNLSIFLERNTLCKYTQPKTDLRQSQANFFQF